MKSAIVQSKLLGLWLIVGLLMSVHSTALAGVSPLGDSAKAWPTIFTPYTFADGTPIYDGTGDEGGGSFIDISSGPTAGVGTKPSVLMAFNQGTLYVRFRLTGDPKDTTRGGYKAAAYSVSIAVGGVQQAVIGLDGKSNTTDYVYVTNAGGTVFNQIYTWPFTTPSAGARSLADGEGGFFLDFQIPVSRITQLVPGITDSTDLQLFYGTSLSANLSQINKDLMTGSSISYAGLGSIRFKDATVRVTKTLSVVSGPNPPQTGLTTVYDMRVTAANIGANTLTNIVVRDTIPGTFTIVSATTASGTINTSGRIITWNPVNQLSGSSDSAVIRVSVSPTSAIYGSTILLNPGAVGTGSDMLNAFASTSTSASVSVGPVGGTPEIIIGGGDTTSTNDTTPTIAGTTNAAVGSTVSIIINGVTRTTTVLSNGTWTINWPIVLTDNSYVVSASVTGTGTGTDTQVLILDSTAPAVSLSSPTNGSSLSDTTPDLSGTAEAGSTVKVYVDGSLVATVTADGSGAWSYTSTLLTQGSHTYYATATDAFGNTSTAPSRSFTVDTIAPSAPSISAPTTGSTTGDNTPTITGTAEANSTVSVYIDGLLVGTTVANGSGNWSFTSSVLADGSHTVYSTSTDAAGNISGASTSNTFSVDTSAPSAPTVSTPANSSVTNDNTPTLAGTAEPGSTVTIYVDGVAAGTVTADGSGNWTMTSSLLADGSHSVYATATDAAGNVSPSSSSNTFQIDATNPSAPAISSPVNGSLTSDNTPAISGTAEANSTVNVYIDGALAGTAVADGSGIWSFTSSILSDGSHTVSATATDGAGNTSASSSVSTFSVDATSASAPTISSPVSGTASSDNTVLVSGQTEPYNIVRIYIDGVFVATDTADAFGNWSIISGALPDGSHSITATSSDAAGNTSVPSTTTTVTIDTAAPSSPTISSPISGSVSADDTPTISGTAEAGTTVKLYANGVLVGTTTADGSGNWTLSSSALSQGSESLVATSTDAAGNTSLGSAATTIVIDSVSPNTPQVSNPSDGSTISDTTPDITGIAEANSTVTVYIDGALAGTVTANGSGNWTLTGITLVAGSHTVSAIATDAAGNSTVSSPVNSFIVDPTAPTIILLSPVDGSFTNDNTPSITGVSDPGNTIKVYVDGVLVSTIIADVSGNWNYTSATLADGAHSVYTVATNVALSSSTSGTNSFTVDTITPVVPVIAVFADGSISNDNTPTLSGTAEPGSRVEITVDGVLVATVTSDGTWNWSYTSSTIGDGSHTMSVTVYDAAGNSVSSGVNTFTIDTIAPSAATITSVPNGTSVNDNTPTLSGTAEANSTVTIVMDGVVVATVTADGSGNWSTTSAILTDGSHTMVVTATDAAGNVSGTTTSVFTVDTAIPSTPVITTFADGGISNDNTPTLAGTAEAGSTVVITVDGIVVATVIADGSGNWSYTSATLTDGSHTMTVTTTDAAGNSTTSSLNTFTIDTIAPSAATITSVPNGTSVNDNTPTLSGTAEANSTVTIIVDGMVIATVIADGSGNWSHTSATLSDGSHTMVVTATDAAGNVSGTTTSVFTVDTAVPSTPVITTLANGSISNDNTPTLAGTAEAGSTVVITVDGVVVATVIADGSGNWSYTSSTLTDGSHTMTVTTTDGAGNTVSSGVNTFTIDTIAPSAATITSVPNGTSVNDNTPTLSGTAEANSTVTIMVDGVVVATVIADGSGNWSYTSAILADGNHTMVITSTDAAGNVSGTTTSVFTVDTAVPSTPVITTFADGGISNDNTPTLAGTAEAGSTVVITVDGVVVATVIADGSGNWSYISSTLTDGSHTMSVTTTDGAGNTVSSSVNTFTIDTIAPSAATITSVLNGSSINDNTPVLSGTAEANSTVTIVMDGVVVATVTADGSGNWSTTSAILTDGSHTMVVMATDAAGNVSGTTTSIFTVDTAMPSTPVITTLANGSVSNENTPTLSGTAEAGSIVVITVDGVVVATVIADGSGNWSYTSSTLTDGSHTMTVTTTDAAGNSATSSLSTFTIDTVSPLAATITSVLNGSSINDNTPVLSGTAEANSTVTIVVDGVVVATVIADGSGNWSYTSAVLADGNHTMVITSTDAAGNVSGTTTSVFTVDTAVPSTPVITTFADGGISNDNTPTLAGTAEAGSTVVITVDGVVVATVIADGSGNWSYTSATLSDGSHTMSVTTTDAAGNSVSSGVNTFTIDTISPLAATITSVLNGSSINDNTPVLSGTAEANSTVTIVMDGVVVATVIADGSGNWSTTSTVLTDGSHMMVVTATDAAGNVSVTTTSVFSVDTAVPSAPVITILANGSISNDNTPTLSGTAEAGSTVVITVDGVVVATVIADGSGNWSYTSAMLSDGSHTMSVTTTDAAGNSASSLLSTFTIDTVAPAAPSIAQVPNGTSTGDNTPLLSGTADPNSTVTLLLDGVVVATIPVDGSGLWSFIPSTLLDGAHALIVTSTDAAGNISAPVTSLFTVDTVVPSAPVVVSPITGSYTNDATPLITGTSEPNSLVIVTIDGTVIDTVLTDASGNWEFTSSTLTDGLHSVSVVSFDAVGNLSALSNVPTFTVDTLTPATAAVVEPLSGVTANDNTPTITGTAEPFSTVRVFIDGVLVGTAIADAAGNWSFTTSALADGLHAITTVAIDRAGNVSALSAPVTFTVDTIAPALPVITSPIQGLVTNNASPVITGTSEPFSTIGISIDGVFQGFTTADALGQWSYPLSNLADGLHTISARATDVAGNVSGVSLTTSFTINTLPVLVSISHLERRVCDPAFTLIVNGLNFLPASVVRVNGVDHSGTYISPTQLSVEITAADQMTPGTKSVAVFTPAPGGGLTGSLSFNVIGASVTGTLYYDRNGDGSRGAYDYGMSGLNVTLTGSNPTNSRTTTTVPGGAFALANLAPDTYVLSFSGSSSWIATQPSGGTYTVPVLCGTDLTGFELGLTIENTPQANGGYRTFMPTQLAEKKAEKKKQSGSGWTFRFVNKTGSPAHALRVRFVSKVCGFYSFSPFTEQEVATDRIGGLPYEDPTRFPMLEGKLFDFSGSTIADGDTVLISGYSCKIIDETVTQYYWVLEDTVIGVTAGGIYGQPIDVWGVMKMPNTANIRNEVFRSGGFSPNDDNPRGGLVVGVPVTRGAGYVYMVKSSQVQKSLSDKSGSHIGIPRGFSTLENGKKFDKSQTTLRPLKHNNRLFANLLTLKFNIEASALGVTPVGFGELIYDEGTNSLSGLTVVEIAARADTMVTFWRGIEAREYMHIDTVINKLNSAFSGSIDTLTYASQLTVKGVCPLTEVPYLRPNPFLAPRTIERRVYSEAIEEPEEFLLNQNYPNPFNPSTTISFSLPSTSVVSLVVYDMLGREVATLLADAEMEEGSQSIEFNAAGMSSGVYFYRVTAKEIADEDETASIFTEVKRMILVK